MNAEDLGWGKPGLSKTTRIKCDGIPLNVRPEVAPLFVELVRWLESERKRLGRPPLSSSGGYIKRLVRGSTSTWSNHSWGLAADFNAATNPMGRKLVTDMPPGTSEKAKSLGMRWGGDYSGRKDAMHFEVVVTPAEAKRLVAGLNKPAVKTATATPPLPTPTVQEDDEMASFLFNDGSKTYWRDGGDTIHVPTASDVDALKARGGVKDLGKLSDMMTARLVEAAKQ